MCTNVVDLGYRVALIGTTLMNSDRAAASCSGEMLASRLASARWQCAHVASMRHRDAAHRRSARTTCTRRERIWVKVCGLTTREAVAAAVEAGADAVGFVFAPSKRKVTAQQAAQLARDVPREIARVAVMLHPSQSELDEVWSEFRPDVLQTDVEDLATLRVPAGLRVMPVLCAPVASCRATLPTAIAVRRPGERRGRDGRLVTRLRSSRAHAADTGRRIEAGERRRGDSDRSAVRRRRQQRRRSAPGVKDPAKIHEFVRSARAADNGADEMRQFA